MIPHGFPYEIQPSAVRDIFCWYQGIEPEQLEEQLSFNPWILDRFEAALNQGYQLGARDASSILWRADA